MFAGGGNRQGIFSYFYAKEPPETVDGVADLPEPSDPQLFDRAGWNPPGSPPKIRPASAPVGSPTRASPQSPITRTPLPPSAALPTPAAALIASTPCSCCGALTASSQAPSVRTPGGGSSLFDRYATSEPPARKVPNAETTTSRLRSQGLRVTCYLNLELGAGGAVAIVVPDTMQTMKELYALIQVCTNAPLPMIIDAASPSLDAKRRETPRLGGWRY